MAFLRWSRSLGLALALLFVACGGIAVIDGDGAGGAASNGSGNNASNGSGAASGSGNSNGSGAGSTCPGCPAGEICEFPDNLCGQGLDKVCVSVPADCSTTPQSPTCGCNGEVYPSVCAAMKQSSVSVLELCNTPDGTFPCGQSFCTLGSQYCEVVVSDVATLPSIYTCRGLPDQCLIGNDPSCSCLQGVPCGDICDEPLPFRFRVTCPGG